MKGRQIFCWLSVILWMAVIFFFSACPREQSADTSGSLIRWTARLVSPDFDTLTPTEQETVVETWQHTVRKTAHFTEYALLGSLLLLALLQHPLRRWQQAVLAAGGGILYAASDELHQLFVPGRGGQWQDVLLDSGGVLAGVAVTAAVLWLIARVKRKKQ